MSNVQHQLFKESCVYTDMEFVQKFTPLDFQVRNFTPSILPNFNNFSKKKTQKMSENGEIYTAAGSNGMDKFHLCCPSMRSHTLKRWLKLFHRYHLVLVCLTVPTLYLPSFILVSGDYFGECIGEQIVFGKIVVA